VPSGWGVPAGNRTRARFAGSSPKVLVALTEELRPER